MTLRLYLIVMSVATVLSWTAVGVVVTMTDPTRTQTSVFIVLFASLFLALTGTLSLLGFLMRVWLLRKRYFVSREVLTSFRQAILLAVLLIAALVMQSRGILSWWNAVLMVAALTALEFFFVNGRQAKRNIAAPKE